jgi:hypothetical protein
MPACNHRATDGLRRSRSRLGNSLLRLQQNLEESRQTTTLTDEQFQAWQDRWYDRREQIARRLELIDRQLDSLVERDRAERPQLSVVSEGQPESQQADPQAGLT